MLIQHACLDGRNHAAAEWVHSRRILHSRHLGWTEELDAFPQLVRSLRALGDEHDWPPFDRLETKALRAAARGKVRESALQVRALLRFAHATGSWGLVEHGRQLLAETYAAAGEPGLAVDHLVLAGQAKTAAATAAASADHYINVESRLASPAYWVAASAFRVVAAHADLVPDDHVEQIAEAAVDVLHRQMSGQLQDSPFFGPTLAIEALRAESVLAGRVTTEQATFLLDYLRPLVPREANRSRFTDDHHVRACIEIAAIHALLRDDALSQLLDLLEQHQSGVAHTVEREAVELLAEHADIIRERLTTMAANGNRSAATLLAQMTDEPSDEQLTAARTAGEQLAEPPRSTATSHGIGIAAIPRSLLARYLPAEERLGLIQAQLDHAAWPYEPGENRADYYRAATNLAFGVNHVDGVDALFDEAMRRATDQGPSHGDILSNLGNHPLSFFTMTGMTVDTRPQATLLAAALARTPDQKTQVRTHAISLLGSDDNSYYCIQALQIVNPPDLINDVPLLAVHQHWAARSLAAITWAHNTPTDPAIGMLLAGDTDPRVRRALASALRDATLTPAFTTVIDKLTTDPRHSVRDLLNQHHDDD